MNQDLAGLVGAVHKGDAGSILVLLDALSDEQDSRRTLYSSLVGQLLAASMTYQEFRRQIRILFWMEIYEQEDVLDALEAIIEHSTRVHACPAPGHIWPPIPPAEPGPVLGTWPPIPLVTGTVTLNPYGVVATGVNWNNYITTVMTIATLVGTSMLPTSGLIWLAGTQPHPIVSGTVS